MKKLLLSSLAILAFTVATFAQWTTVNSNLAVGRGVGQISVGMNDPTALWAYAVDNTGAIVDSYTKSTNSGTTWTLGTFNAGTGLSQLFAIDATTCWAVFNTGATQGLYKTTNGGTTWTKQGAAYGSSSFADAMHFFNATDGWALGDPNGGYFEIYTTTDGGTTWTRVPQANIPAPLSGEYGITGDYCAFGDNIWYGTNKGRIFRSTDKGVHWAATLLPFGTSQTVAPEFVDAQHGIAYRSFLNVGLGDSLNVTSDGGATWQGLAVSGSFYGRYVIHVPGTSTYVGSAGVAGTDQGISFSYDGGNNWYVITAGGDYQANSWLNLATGWCGSTANAKKSTGGMYIYNGDTLQGPVAHFSTPDTLVALGNTSTFTSTSSGNITTYAWTFQDGLPATSSLQNPPAITWQSPGRKNVTLHVTGPWGTNTLVKTGYVYVGGVGFNELSQSTVSIFPNPVKDYMMIQSGYTIKEIQLFNGTGQMVASQTVSAKTVNLNTSALPSGLYNLKTILENGTVTKKVIIQ